MKTAALALILGLSIQTAAARPPALVDPATGKFLGYVSKNPYDPNSTSNPYGQYGSKYSPDSINNEYGQYGSKYSPNSPNNPYATGYGGSSRSSAPSSNNAPPVALPALPALPGF